jgi:hypothetical protein
MDSPPHPYHDAPSEVRALNYLRLATFETIVTVFLDFKMSTPVERIDLGEVSGCEILRDFALLMLEV